MNKSCTHPASPYRRKCCVEAWPLPESCLLIWIVMRLETFLNTTAIWKIQAMSLQGRNIQTALKEMLLAMRNIRSFLKVCGRDWVSSSDVWATEKLFLKDLMPLSKAESGSREWICLLHSAVHHSCLTNPKSVHGWGRLSLLSSVCGPIQRFSPTVWSCIKTDTAHCPAGGMPHTSLDCGLKGMDQCCLMVCHSSTGGIWWFRVFWRGVCRPCPAGLCPATLLYY